LIVQRAIPAGANYYSDALIASVRALSDPVLARQFVRSSLSSLAPTFVAPANAIAAALDTMDPTIGSVVISDNNIVYITAAQASDAALAKLVNANGSPVAVNVKDGGANVTANFDAIAAAPFIWHLNMTDKVPITVTAAQFVNGAAILRSISGASGGVIVQDTAANVVAQAPGLVALMNSSSPHFSKVILSDNAPLRLTAAQVTAYRLVLQSTVNANGTPRVITTIG
jgi:hypothetical protein